MIVVISGDGDLELIATGGTILRVVVSCLDDELAGFADCLLFEDTGTVAQRLSSTGIHEERVLLPGRGQVS